MVRYVEAKGEIVRDCPGTRHHICCGYKTIDLVEGCPLSCSYCIMQAYINTPGIRVTTNTDYITAQLDGLIDNEKTHILRFGTGELSDSLAVDRKLRLNAPLMDYFGNKRKAILELKSKWASIDHLLPHINPYTVISFSLAPQRMIDREERRTSSLIRRLKTLRKAQQAGAFVGIHLDPIVIYDGFEKDYEYLIDDIARIIDLDRVLWLSMGLLRFPPELYDLFLKNGRNNLLAGEFGRGEDGKYRYPKGQRMKIYRMLSDRLKERNKDLFLYLCMERDDIWEYVFGTRLNDSEGLVRLFDSRIKKLYGGLL